MAEPLEVWQNNVRSAFPEEQLQANALWSLEQGLREVFPPLVGGVTVPDAVPLPHQGRVVIAGFGPSLVETWGSIPDLIAGGAGELWALNGAHDFLIRKGVIPDRCVLIDPAMFDHPDKVRLSPHPGVTYYIASQAGRDVIERVAKGAGRDNIRLFHMQMVGEVIPDRVLVPHGGTVGTTAPWLALYLGFRDLHLFGIDASNKAGEYHPGQPSPAHRTVMEVFCAGRWFETLPAYASQVDDMVEFHRQTADLSAPVAVTYWGDGLLQWRMRQHST